MEQAQPVFCYRPGLYFACTLCTLEHYSVLVFPSDHIDSPVIVLIFCSCDCVCTLRYLKLGRYIFGCVMIVCAVQSISHTFAHYSPTFQHFVTTQQFCADMGISCQPKPAGHLLHKIKSTKTTKQLSTKSLMYMVNRLPWAAQLPSSKHVKEAESAKRHESQARTISSRPLLKLQLALAADPSAVHSPAVAAAHSSSPQWPQHPQAALSCLSGRTQWLVEV